jgi:hypothetical protein
MLCLLVIVLSNAGDSEGHIKAEGRHFVSLHHPKVQSVLLQGYLLELQEIQEAISKRNGAVLSAYIILKSDQYPSLHSSSLPQLLPGAPNFRQADLHAPVFGTGISSVSGICATLDTVGANKGGQRCAVCINLREEPVLYINGNPYVLREAAGAYTNMKEYGGIDAPRLEDLEKRLKAEVLAEAQRMGGRVHVLREMPQAQVRH